MTDTSDERVRERFTIEGDTLYFGRTDTQHGFNLGQLIDRSHNALDILNGVVSEREAMRERLEVWPVDPKTGEFVKDAMLPDDCDGIGCRDETIRALERRVEAMRKVVEAARDEHFEIKGVVALERAAIAKLISDTNMRYLESRIKTMEAALDKLDKLK